MSDEFTTGTVLTQARMRALASVVGLAQTQVEVVNTVVATDVVSVTVPAGILSTKNALRLTLIGDYLNNDGAVRGLTLTASYGASAIISSAPNLEASASRRNVRIEVMLGAGNAANVQRGMGSIIIGGAGGGAGGDAGALPGSNAAGINHLGAAFSLAVDSASAQSFKVTVTHGTASTNISFRMQYAVLELLRLE